MTYAATAPPTSKTTSRMPQPTASFFIAASAYTTAIAGAESATRIKL
jgi:hypothetical protein